uniref:hypothetical protein n=1 Tax=Acetatifactor sp. TaxID=1872090 RepID=UPI004055B927
MAKTKKMNYREMREMLRAFESMSNEMKEDMAKLNKRSVDELKAALEHNCYAVGNLGINQMKALRKDIEVMTADDIAAVERVNGRTVDEVVYALDTEISEYEEDMKKQRAFNKAWKVRQAEVQQQLIAEGVDKVESYGCMNINFMEHQKRMAEAQVALAKEMGIHFRHYDPFLGWIEA